METVLTMDQAMALQPAWVGYWLKWLMFGAVFLPISLLIWRETRILGVLTVLAAVLSGFGVYFMYGNMGFTKLLGLPHIIVWTPLVFYMLSLLRGGKVPKIARVIMMVVLATILISLAFDYSDAVRYLLGERTPLAGTI